ncbi:diguanylate cyclase domain-containing protein [Neptuniibacter caesariensis]|uniref:diguanylate cyclase n=1 Tax=Neptuniibacter caesariensis TaxID=207954 RepID=A0A7U8C8Y0_NEPCE|nr:diguanylate cyclase [Neptuniibacter caesariensis]EAR62746.1 sensory box/ggdef family protein [Oceanospirillum sp. MED92] [Neptuniibacter caesariensis]
MQPYRNLIFGFVFIISLMIGLGGFSLFHLNNISKDVENIYNHPFAVSNAGQSIQTLVFAMHRDMKDVVLAKTPEQVRATLEQVHTHEQKVLKEFDIIFERFLGNKSQIKQTYQTFIEWKNIRDEVANLALAGETEAAAIITKTRGAQHVDKLLGEVHEFVLFARKKADEFRSQSASNRDHSIYVVSTISFLTLIFSILIAFKVIARIQKAQKELGLREHLVDQNIMMATMDTEGVVLDASNALCRFLGTTKEEMIGKPSHFFDNSDNQNDLSEKIWRTIRTGKAWQGEICHIAPDGLLHWASSRVLPTLDENFKVTGFTNLLQDSTSKKLSITDKLTTLPNRRSFEEVLQREIKQAYRHNRPITLAILDVDFFKRYNDTYGHPQGDKALRMVADCILECLRRPTDFAFRIGGEEFAIVIADQDLQQSQVFLDSIREKVEALEIPHSKSDVSGFVTISIGAFWTRGSDNPDKALLYAEADKALYLAKNSRNQCVVQSASLLEDNAA